MKEKLSRAVPPLLTLAAIFLGCEEDPAPQAPELRVEGVYIGTSSASEIESIAFDGGKYQIHRGADRWEHGSFARRGSAITFTPDEGAIWTSELETFAGRHIKRATLVTGGTDLLPGASAERIRLTNGRSQELVSVKDPQSIIVAEVGDRIPSILMPGVVLIVVPCPPGVPGVPPGRCFKTEGLK